METDPNPSDRRRILVADDEIETREPLRLILEADGYEVQTACNGDEALQRLRAESFHLLITDCVMAPGPDGLSVLATVRAEKLPMGVMLLTGFGDYQMALDAMRTGADDFLSKPCDAERLRMLVRRVLARRELNDELEQLRKKMREDYGFHDLVSKNPRMRKVFDLIEKVGPTPSSVLIHGETGTGKELVARAIHSASDRNAGPFKAVNCAALTDNLLASELFGHERGSFTGADRRKLGRFELADKGTLFLDEIGDVSPSMQAKLLRVLQGGTFERVGGTETVRVDVRIVAASNKKLEEEVKAGRFRSDLFYRLNVIRIDLPPLRERTEDIPLLATHFLERFALRSTPPVTRIDPDAMQALLAHPWPGNVRELENAIKGAVAMADGTSIHRRDLPASVAPRQAPLPMGEPRIDVDRPLLELTESLIQRVEREYFSQLLGRYQGNISRCAEHSGLSRRSVALKLQKCGLDRAEFLDVGESPDEA
ncbi:MAG: sigma-54 dependent transcriptional regulator [Isosphaeraceae bacterium]